MEVEFKLVSPGLVGVATALEGKYGYDVIYAISDYADRPERLSRLGLHLVLQTVHLIMSTYWAYCARMDYIPGMAFAYSAMLVRTCGNVMFTVGVALYETFILIPTDLRVWYASLWVVIEGHCLWEYHGRGETLYREAGSCSRGMLLVERNETPVTLVYVLGQLCVYSHGLSKAAREQELEPQPGPAEELQAETPEQFELETSPHASPHRTMLS
ncbi:hypothetical protein HPB47_016340 [Ixodes persulcatus]|uniref:Uncharacterized protein n=1 Tax=Ixodes persulcatus TaxID=34615 RepID=A0AC60QT60_IXOPE|nr:hypothetical protein HPB47_016340 [Ixodes persulcatus]